MPRDLVELCRDLTAGAKRWPLFVYGEPGVGKSRFGLCVSDIIPGAMFWDISTLAAVAFNQESRYWEVAARAPLIIIDELGTKKNDSEFEYQALKRFADLRDRRDARTAIYLSNLPPAALAAHYDDRVASRILCGTQYKFIGPDRRMG